MPGDIMSFLFCCTYFDLGPASEFSIKSDLHQLFDLYCGHGGYFTPFFRIRTSNEAAKYLDGKMKKYNLSQQNSFDNLDLSLINAASSGVRCLLFYQLPFVDNFGCTYYSNKWAVVVGTFHMYLTIP